MRIDRVRVRNFRNLADLDLSLLPGTVVVGENRAGKSNLVHAIRLVLDPGMSSLDRRLTREDFWDGLSDGTVDWDPMRAGQEIEISVDIVDFDDDPAVLAALSDALVAQEPLRARLTYKFAPVDTGSSNGGDRVKYRFNIFGGETAEQLVAADLRDHLHLVFLHALRDVESHLNSRRGSPLRALLEAAAQSVDEGDLAKVRDAMREANQSLNGLKQITEVSTGINNRITTIVGPKQALETDLKVASDDPLRLIRNMKLMVDGTAGRRLGSTSLGTLNVLYLALLELQLEQRLTDSDIAHVVMAIEEPEAHLHPHVQRLVFRRFLSDEQSARSVLVTTQSPHIASVTSPRSLVVMRDVGGRTTAAAAHTADLAEADWDDIARYLDATRAEMVFARSVLLVEGYAEQVLVPAVARTAGIDLDKLGITVCAIHGTHFRSYAKFCTALGIPWAVLTDGDDGAGQARATNLGGEFGGVTANIFVGTTTFENDLLNADARNIEPCFSVLRELGSSQMCARVEGWNGTPPGQEPFLSAISTVGGKGRFAHRLSRHEVHAPAYVLRALEHLSS
ncbi:ATP-dependent nuclease [Actinokineospora globicatena]|uniref:ATP-dependent nuclease n=1 Tax=Actinokineospora globicatena TaxID=103729 RepID=UPI002552C6F8|nr:AAA family ATPase [Actinokineospora globicatena]